MAEPRSTQLIAEGRCPGWSSYADTYRVDHAPSIHPCKRKISRGDLCGVCDNRRTARQREIARIEAVRERRAQADKDHSHALNLANFLTDELALPDVKFSASGPLVTLTIPEAGALLRWARLVKATRT